MAMAYGAGTNVKGVRTAVLGFVEVVALIVEQADGRLAAACRGGLRKVDLRRKRRAPAARELRRRGRGHAFGTVARSSALTSGSPRRATRACIPRQVWRTTWCETRKVMDVGRGFNLSVTFRDDVGLDQVLLEGVVTVEGVIRSFTPILSTPGIVATWVTKLTLCAASAK